MHSKRQVFLPAIGAREDPEDIYIYIRKTCSCCSYLVGRDGWEVSSWQGHTSFVLSPATNCVVQFFNVALVGQDLGLLVSMKALQQPCLGSLLEVKDPQIWYIECLDHI